VTGSILIQGGAVVTMDDAGRRHDRGYVVVEDDLVVEVGSGDASGRGADRVIDAGGMVVMPGMVNAHTHLFQTFLRGLADDKPLLQWLAECIWPAARHFTAADAEAAAMLGLVENLRTGATSVIDHQYIHPAPDIDEAVCRAADRLGVRFLLARGWADRNYDPPLMETAETVISRTETLWEGWAGHPRIRIELAPLIPWGCSDEGMGITVAASRRRGAGTHIHCAETRTEVEMNLDERGTRHVDWLDGLGVLGPDVQLAHGVWLEDDELDLIAARGSVVVHCPTSNMYLASGIAPVAEMRRRGIPVALASDGPGSNNRQDMFEAMKNGVLLAKISGLDPMALQPEDALWMATRGGALALREPVGRIEPGAKADLVVVDLESPFIAPVHRFESALVFNATPRDVHTVIVDGRVLLSGRQLLGVDERAILAEARDRCRALFERSGLAREGHRD
jgi:5-methylthioadenosine/S-adenosylhomocysteine deaminase